jgi:hypothetical protein
MVTEDTEPQTRPLGGRNGGPELCRGAAYACHGVTLRAMHAHYGADGFAAPLHHMKQSRVHRKGVRGEEERKCSFLKKRTKKLLLLRFSYVPTRQSQTGPNSQAFFGSFFQKRTRLFRSTRILWHWGHMSDV